MRSRTGWPGWKAAQTTTWSSRSRRRNCSPASTRSCAARPSAPRDETLAYSDLKLNPPTREVTRGLRRIDLTAKEFELLRYLLRHPRQVLSRDQILQEVWGYDFGGEDNVLEVYVGYLRKKTEAAGEPRLIQTVRGVGYTLREDT